jgi:hypothetical protein
MFMRRLREISDRSSGMRITPKGVLRTTELEAPKPPIGLYDTGKTP